MGRTRFGADLSGIPFLGCLLSLFLSLLGWAEEGSRVAHGEHAGVGPILTLALISCASWGSFLYLSESQIPHVWNGMQMRIGMRGGGHAGMHSAEDLMVSALKGGSPATNASLTACSRPGRWFGLQTRSGTSEW